jgi:dTDP-glucose pyrophosphorylase
MAKRYAGPKQLLPVAGKPLVEHTLEAIPDAVGELVLVVGGPYEEAIRAYFGAEHGGRKVTYVHQPEPKGLGHAIQQTRDVIRGRFLVLLPDDLFVRSDIEKLIAEPELSALAQRRPDFQRFGVFVCDAGRCLVRAVEKPQEFISDLVSAGPYVLDKEFFEVEVPPSARGEIELPDIVNALVRRGRKIRVVEATFWAAVNDPEQLSEAEKLVRARARNAVDSLHAA